MLLQGPTGTGKSAIHVALARQAWSAFYTTPEKKLRQQLADDDHLSSHYSTLRARADYMCRYPDVGRYEEPPTCKECYVNNSENLKCYRFADQGCTYWAAKEDAMQDSCAVVTFAGLVVDGHLPTAVEIKDEGRDVPMQISFVVNSETHQPLSPLPEIPLIYHNYERNRFTKLGNSDPGNKALYCTRRNRSESD